MTESEAKTKWCPFVRAIGDTDVGTMNRWTEDDGGKPNPFGNTNLCIGSACMAWRVTDNECAPSDPDSSIQPKPQAAGHCGLAGSPWPPGKRVARLLGEI